MQHGVMIKYAKIIRFGDGMEKESLHKGYKVIREYKGQYSETELIKRIIAKHLEEDTNQGINEKNRSIKNK